MIRGRERGGRENREREEREGRERRERGRCDKGSRRERGMVRGREVRREREVGELDR